MPPENLTAEKVTLLFQEGSVTSRNGKARFNADNREYVLQQVQPALVGLMDCSVSTSAPLVATAGLTHRSRSAFFAGLAASVGAG